MEVAMHSSARITTTVLAIGLLILCAPAPSAAAEATLLIDNAGYPTWSPAGDAIACARLVSGTDHVQVWTVPVGGGDPVMRTQDPDEAYMPTWLPDGGRIVYAHMRDADEGVHYEFVIHDLATGVGVVREVPTFWDDPGFYLSPDASELLYTGYLNPRETWAVNLETGATRVVGPGIGGMISPDGQWFASFTDEDSLVVTPLTGGEGVTLGYGGYGRWTRDSRFIIFTTFVASGNPDLVAVSRDGTYRQQLTDDADIEWSNDVSPAGDRLAYCKSAGEFEPASVWLLDLQLPTETQSVTWGRIKDRYR
jgi:Tol biopolymer transport system component